MTLFSKDYHPYHLRTHEETLASIKESIGEADVTLLRPHHLHNWSLLHFHGFNSLTGTFDPKKYADWLKSGHARAASQSIKELLVGDQSPSLAGQQVEYLNILNDPDSKTLTQRDREVLQSLQISPEMFASFAARTANKYQKIWEKPDDSNVVVARVLDFECYMLSEKGCRHCTQPVNVGDNTDEIYLWALAHLKEYPRITQKIKDGIKIYLAKQTNVIECVVFPLFVLKDYPTILQIDHLVANYDYYSTGVTP